MFRPCLAGILLAFSAGVGLGQQPHANNPPFPRGRGGMNPNREMMLERWSRMTPEERQRALEKLPPERRERIEQQLKRYQSLSPEERQRLRARMEAWDRLPPEERDQRRELFRRFSSLPDDRRPMVRRELNYLRNLPEADRQARLASEAFRNRYSPEEQLLLREMAGKLSEPAGH